MLEYEKKLHFDKHYEKLQSAKNLGMVGRMIQGILGYLVLYIFLKYVFTYIPDLQPWNTTGVLFKCYSVSIFKLDCVYFGLGLLGYGYGSVRLMKVSHQNHSVRKNGEERPTGLLTDGCYAKVRHPMYGTFIILEASLWLSLRSFIGIVLTIVIWGFQYFNAVHEEKKKLIPYFKEEYRNYSKAVPRMLLNKVETYIIIITIVFSLIGVL